MISSVSLPTNGGLVSLLQWHVYIYTSLLPACKHSIPPFLPWGIHIAIFAAAAALPPRLTPHTRPIQHPGELLQVLGPSSMRWLMNGMNCTGGMLKMERWETEVKWSLRDKRLGWAEQGQTSWGYMFTHRAAVRVESGPQLMKINDPSFRPVSITMTKLIFFSTLFLQGSANSNLLCNGAVHDCLWKTSNIDFLQAFISNMSN